MRQIILALVLLAMASGTVWAVTATPEQYRGLEMQAEIGAGG